MSTSIPTNKKEELFNNLKKANKAFQELYPGDRSERQPVHTLYGGANLFKYDAASYLGKRALEIFETYAPDDKVFGKVFGLDVQSGFSSKVYNKVIAKLKTEAIEDFRIDFEDGYGNRSNEEEDETARTAALEVARGMAEKTLPPFIGIRIKPFTEEMKERGLRTLDIFITTLVKETNGKLPDNFIVMLPKVTIAEQPATLAAFFDILEKELNLERGILKMEMMVETTQAIMSIDGTNPLYKFIKASNGRCIAMHFGTYDYTASCSITAKYQEMDHPVCDFAHHMTKVALAHTGIWLSDGATNTMPIGPHRGDDLSKEQLQENMDTVHRAWKKGYDHIRHSLWNGFYQGWDLNPAQFPMRYAAVYAFFLESYDDAVERLKTFVEKAARATLIGDVFDDAATGQGLLNYFLRALNSGAITEDEVLATGLTLEEIRGRSFKKILENRKR
ncbi:MAG: phosphoenolpyruvate kinase [Ferruginibacter sp.]|nr:phosphoenolpyruvate kinase [Bacteroidota bacterium]MBX2917996.1 phosphoenolpyruvate kinase [Ferruginibacter sp.]MCC7379454.1 phosphoenolpyruvate kinase [Chitinophagaceae bacterium]